MILKSNLSIKCGLPLRVIRIFFRSLMHGTKSPTLTKPLEAHYKRIVTRLRKDLERLDTVFNIAVKPSTQKQNIDSPKDSVTIESSGTPKPMAQNF